MRCQLPDRGLAVHSAKAARELPRRCSAARRCTRADSSAATSAETSGTLLRVTLKRPLGLVFAERVKGGAGGVFVEEVTTNSNAAKAGVLVGDVLLRCSAVVLKTGKEGAFANEGYGATPFTNFERIIFECADQRCVAPACGATLSPGVLTPPNLRCSFENVMGAIASNNARWGITDVTLELLQGAAPAPTSTPPPPVAAAPVPVAAAPKPTASSTLVEVKVAAVDGKTTNILVNGSNVGQPLRALMQAEKLAVYEAGWSSMMNCGGAGQCGMCIVAIYGGDALLSERTDAEARHLTKKGKPANWRLACQTCVNDGATGAVEVQAQPQAKK